MFSLRLDVQIISSVSGNSAIVKFPTFLSMKIHLCSFENKLVSIYDTSYRLIQMTLTLTCQFFWKDLSVMSVIKSEYTNSSLFLSYHKICHIKIHSLYLNKRKKFYKNIPFIWLVIEALLLERYFRLVIALEGVSVVRLFSSQMFPLMRPQNPDY